MRRLFADWLEQAGFHVTAAHNGHQAFDHAVDLAPDVVVTDLHLPGMDGYELTRRLKTDARTRHIPIVAVTGYGPYTQDPSRANRAGCDTILPKPCTQEDLEFAVRSLIEPERRPQPA